jgi:hypothetical protein
MFTKNYSLTLVSNAPICNVGPGFLVAVQEESVHRSGVYGDTCTNSSSTRENVFHFIQQKRTGKEIYTTSNES